MTALVADPWLLFMIVVVSGLALWEGVAEKEETRGEHPEGLVKP